MGDVITGRVEQGTIHAGDVVRVAPRGLSGLKVFSVEMHHKTWPDAKPGDNVGMNVKGLDKKNMPKVGDVMSLESQPILEPVDKFTAQIVVQEHPGQLKPGFAPLVHVRTAKSSCKMTKIHWKMVRRPAMRNKKTPSFWRWVSQPRSSLNHNSLFILRDLMIVLD